MLLLLSFKHALKFFYHFLDDQVAPAVWLSLPQGDFCKMKTDPENTWEAGKLRTHNCVRRTPEGHLSSKHISVVLICLTGTVPFISSLILWIDLQSWTRSLTFLIRQLLQCFDFCSKLLALTANHFVVLDPCIFNWLHAIEMHSPMTWPSESHM